MVLPFMSSMMANVVPNADKTAAVQQISPIHDGKYTMAPTFFPYAD